MRSPPQASRPSSRAEKPLSHAVNKTAILTIILTSYVMLVLDTSIVLTGLPSIHRELGFSDPELAWVQSAYTLTFGGFLLLGARAGDILGRKRMLTIGLALFTASSLAIGLAETPAWMIGARAVQGFGGAVLAPATLALLQTTFAEGTERTRAVSYYSAVAGIAASVGLVLGGILAEWLSWRVGFFINLPIGLGMILAAIRFVPETGRQSGRLDIAGGLTSTIGMVALVYGLIRSATHGWHDSLTIGLIATSLLLLVAFVAIERNARQPIMPLRLFASRERVGAYSARMLFLGGMIGFFFFTTQFLQSVLGYSAAATGLAFLPATLVNFASAMAVPQLTKRFGNARLLATGFVLTLVGMTWLSRVSADADYLSDIALPMILIGWGQGFVLSPLTASGISGVSGADAGAASGVVNVAHQLGNSLGLAILVAVTAFGTSGLEGIPLLAHRVTMALTSSAAMMALALVLVLALIVRQRHPASAIVPVAEESVDVA
ncbi:MFS transporter [Rhizobium indicum]|uniref:MFS transporter n=1 Tax=Rhizobium indicum TaxID=2583231 RepID=UPI00110726DE|nr:MFS transporter [Rhizobium indicum]QKK32275.1 MFS transporter [Rhizobium indicum]